MRQRFRPRKKVAVYKLARLTLRDVLMQSAADYADRPALGTVDGSTVLNYRDVASLSAAFARQLVEAGLQKGDRVVVLSENRPEWGVAYMGATAAGFVIVPILTDFIPEQVGNIIAHSEAKAVVVSDKLSPRSARTRAS